MSVFAAKLLKAEVPEGSVNCLERPSLTRAPGTIIQSTLDIIYGVPSPRSGLGSASLETAHGKYQLLRDLGTNELAVETIWGRTPPDSSVISPGQWLLQRQRDPFSKAKPETTPTAELSRRLLLRAKRLESTASRLAAIERIRSNTTDEEVPSEVRAQLEAAVERVLCSEAEGIEQRLEQNAVITACLEDLAKGDSGNPNSEAAQKLRNIAELMDGAPRQSKRAWANFLQRLTPAWAAGVLAGGGVTIGGLTLDEPSWVPVGAALAGSGLAAMAAGRALTRTGQSPKRRKSRKAALHEQATEALYQARVLLADEQVIDANFLRHKASVVARRDLVGSLASRLEKVTLSSEEKERLERRQEMVKRSIPKALRARLVEVKDREPMLAIPGLLDRLDEDYKRGLVRAERESRFQNVRVGAESALMAEAARLRQRAGALARQAGALKLWNGLVDAEPKPRNQEAPWEKLFEGMSHSLTTLGRTSESSVRKSRPELLRIRKTKGAPALQPSAGGEKPIKLSMRPRLKAPKHLRQRPAAARWRHQLRAPAHSTSQTAKTPAFNPPVKRANEAAASAAADYTPETRRAPGGGSSGPISPSGPRTQVREHLQVVTPTALRAPLATMVPSLNQETSGNANAGLQGQGQQPGSSLTATAPKTVMHVVVNRQSRWARRSRSRSDRQNRTHRSRRNSARVTPSIRLPRVAPLRIQPIAKPAAPALMVGLKGLAILPLNARALPENLARRTADRVSDLYVAPTFALVSWQTYAIAVLDLSRKSQQATATWLALEFPKLQEQLQLLLLPKAKASKLDVQCAWAFPRTQNLHPTQLLSYLRSAAAHGLRIESHTSAVFNLPLDASALPRIESKAQGYAPSQIHQLGFGLSPLVQLILPAIAQRSPVHSIADGSWFSLTTRALDKDALPNTDRWNRQASRFQLGAQVAQARIPQAPGLHAQNLPPLRLRQSKSVNTLDAYTRLSEHGFRTQPLLAEALPTTPRILRIIEGIPFENASLRLSRSALPKLGTARRWRFERAVYAELGADNLRLSALCKSFEKALAPRREFSCDIKSLCISLSSLNFEVLPRFAMIRLLAMPGPWMVHQNALELSEDQLPRCLSKEAAPEHAKDSCADATRGVDVASAKATPEISLAQPSSRKSLNPRQAPNWQAWGKKLTDPRSLDSFECFDQKAAAVPGISVLENDHA